MGGPSLPCAASAARDSAVGDGIVKDVLLSK